MGAAPVTLPAAWMTATPFSYQCLPLVIANQWGWQVLCPTDVQVTWDGSPGLDGLRIDVDPQYTLAVLSRFGSGIVTFKLPWLFRTPPGWDLYAKGPSNRWKTNCVSLEGVIETWWLKFPFTLNWKLVEPGMVTFAGGRAWASSCRCRTRRFRTHRPERLPSRPSIPSSSLNCSGGMRNGSVSPTSRSGSTFAIAGRMRSRSISSKFRFHRSPPPAMAFRKRWPMLPSSDPCPLFRSPTGDRGEKQKDGTTGSTASLLHIVPSLERA